MSAPIDPDLVARALAVLAEELNEQYPHLVFTPTNGAPTKPGGRLLPGAVPEDREGVGSSD